MYFGGLYGVEKQAFDGIAGDTDFGLLFYNLMLNMNKVGRCQFLQF